jgi:energy-coupling factor transporter ATP-binding protein EcfA2
MARAIENGSQATEAEVRVVNIEIRKHSKYRVNEDVAIGVAQELMSVVNRAGSQWKIDLMNANATDWLRRIAQDSTGPADYAMFFRMSGPNSKNADIEINTHISNLAKRGAQFKGEPWKINRVNGSAWVPLSVTEKLEREEQRRADMVSYADAALPANIGTSSEFFSEMYGVEPQIRLLLSRIQTAISSDFAQRFHAILMGPPGCGKSQLLACLKNALVQADPNSVMSFDGTAITSQGITKELNKLDVMPRFIFVEEIEKAPADAVAVFLGMMDDRGQLRKTTYRENIEKECRVIVFATANNEEKLNAMQSGALASRFVAPIKFRRPTDDMLRQILIRDLDKMGFTQKSHPQRTKWIEKTLEWCHRQDVDNLDPRYVRSVCLNGRDELLTGQYQSDLEATMDITAHF